MTSLEQAFLAQAAFAFLLPLVAGWWFHRRTGAGWRWFGYGMLVFLVLELVMVAAGMGLAFATRIFAPNAPAPSPAMTVAGIGILSAVVEEIGRYFGYVILFGKEARTWARAVMYGLGHGGFESMVNKALTGLFSAVALMLAPTLATNSHGLAPAQAAALEAYAKSLAAMTPWQAIPPAIALASGLAMHCACAVMVLQVFRNRGMKWLSGAIALHAAFDLTMGMGYLMGREWMIVLLAIAWAIVCLRLIVVVRPAGEDTVDVAKGFAEAASIRTNE